MRAGSESCAAAAYGRAQVRPFVASLWRSTKGPEQTRQVRISQVYARAKRLDNSLDLTVDPAGTGLPSRRPDAGGSAVGADTTPDFHGEFDPGSGRTLAACLTHASGATNQASAWGKAANG